MIWALLPLFAAAGELTEWTRDDGTVVVLNTDARVPIVQLSVQFPAGTWHPGFESLDDTLDLALFDEAGTLRRRVDAVGARVNFSAGSTLSSLGITVLADQLDEAQPLLVDLLSTPALDAKQALRDRRSQQIGWAQSLKEPSFVQEQLLDRAFYVESDPRRRDVEAPEPVSTDMDQHVALRDRLVRLPGRRVGVSGDIDRARVDALLDALLPAPEGEALDTPLPPALQQPGPELTAELPKLTQVYLAMARDAPRYDHPDIPALRVAAHVLGGHFHSRLYQALRHEDGDTYGASARVPYSRWPERMELSTFTRADNADVAKDKLLGALTTFFEAGITQEELDGAIGWHTGRQAFAEQTPYQEVSKRLAELEWEVEPGFRERELARIQALSLEEVNAVIQRWFDPADFTFATVGPRD